VYYPSAFSCARSILQVQCANSGEPFATSTKVIRKRLAAIGKNKSIGPDSVSGEILKLGGEALIPHLARLLDITINNATIPCDWKKATVVPIYKGGDRSLVANYRPVSLTSVVCKRMEHVTASYLRKLCDKKDWLSEGRHGFRPGYSCESQVTTVCQDIADSLDNGGRLHAIIIDFSKAFDLVPHDRLLTKIAASGVDSRVVVWVGNSFRAARSRSRRAIVGGSQSNVRSAASECIGSTAVSRLRKRYLEKY
jgi:hypothetical protein